MGSNLHNLKLLSNGYLRLKDATKTVGPLNDDQLILIEGKL